MRERWPPWLALRCGLGAVRAMQGDEAGGAVNCGHIAHAIGQECPRCLEEDTSNGDAYELELERSVYRESFDAFVSAAWPLLEPNGRPFVPNIASSAVIEHLQAVADGKITRLAIAVEPGIGKSTIASIAYPAWMWTRQPAHRFACASHAHDLAVTLSRRTRRLIESQWYTNLFGIVLRTDQNRADDFENTASGRRLAVGVGGALLGQRADTAIVDDSLSAADARSKATRDGTNEWYSNTLTTRLDDPDRAAQIVIQQRLAGMDLIGYLQELGGFEMLTLSAEYEPHRRTVTSIWEDPRTEPGQVLAPEIHSATYLAEQKKMLGTAGYSAMYLQNPTDEEGGMFARHFWRFHKPDGTSGSTKRPRGCSDAPAVTCPRTDGINRAFTRIVISLDAAFKDGAQNDAVCFLVVGLLGAERYVIDRRYGRMASRRRAR